MSDLEIFQFPCLGDNYGILIHDHQNNLTASIDAPEAEAITAALKTKGWSLTHILITHHHFDHTGGNEALKKETGCKIIGPEAEASKIPCIDEKVKEGDIVQFGNHKAKIFETPGHTAGHISYWFENDKVIFVGDTLFAMGCGRLFEGDARTMWTSLEKIISLPKDTTIYCGHEYTVASAEFSLTVEPGNKALQERYEHVKKLRENKEPTLPTTLEIELKTNPFIRTFSQEIQENVNMEGHEDWEIFKAVRELKDNY